MKNKANILKIALFATGLSGIVAEYILSTLATYFLGNSVLQWTMIVSLMLFSMGLGSRFSRFFKKNLLEYFIGIEFLLSVLVSFSALICYSVAGFSPYVGFVIYFLCIFIGVLIGMEIPLVIRINDQYEPLRVNIASALEKDYYGSLIGGVFFAFVGIPFLGLTFTPFVLGMVNFLVALLVFFRLQNLLLKKFLFRLRISLVFVGILLIAGFFMASPIMIFSEQARYKDKVIYQAESKYQKIVVTQWKDDYWLYINGNQQLSTLDEYLYHEPLVHPIVNLAKKPQEILVLGGGDGCAVRELLKYSSIQKISLVDLDPMMTDLAKNNPIFKNLNKNAFNNSKVEVFNADGFNFLEDKNRFYDLIIVDLPDPKSIDLNKLYTKEFYQLCYLRLRKNGFLITQAGSPYYASKAFECIDTSMQTAGFQTVKLHNQILTLGEWGWILGGKNTNSEKMKSQLLETKFENIETRWLNQEAMKLITSFGKNLIETGEIKVNTISNPVLYRYYLEGNWDLY